MAKKRIEVFVFVVLLVASFTAFAQTTTPGSRITTPTASRTAPDLKSDVLASPDPLGPATLIREYILPVGAVGTTYVPSNGPSYPTDITYDDSGFIWFTDIINNRIYRLTPATALNQTATVALKWQLPLTLNITRGPVHIIVDDANTCVWFTDYTSMQISRLDWTNNRLTDWTIPMNWNLHPWDLIMDAATGHIWFTALNTSKFGELNPVTSGLNVYNLVVMGDTGGQLPVRLAEMKASGNHFYMTDLHLDYLYRVNFANVSLTGALVYPLVPGGFSMGLALDSNENVWVTQPANDLVNEQLVGSTNKKVGSISVSGTQLERDDNTVDPNLIGIAIEITRVRPKDYNIPPEILGDPLAVWTVPSSSSWPWGITIDTEERAWYTEYARNQIAVIDPSSNNISEFLVPTTNSHPLYITVPIPTMPPFVTHVWFTELTGGKIGELFGASYVNVRVAPSLAPQYPPPTPGSIRWTIEPGAEIWIDAPSDGYSSADHDIPERNAVNRLYARVVNMGVSTATSVGVRFYYHNMSVSFSQFIPLAAAPSPTHWIAIGGTTIASLPPSVSTDVYVDWTINASVPNHFCIGVQVSVSDDINLYDNVAYRNFDILTTLAGVPTTLYVPIWATNTLNGAGAVRVTLTGVPEGWTASVKPNGFTLGQGESRLLNLTIQVPSSAKAGMRAVIEVTGMINGTVTGMVWIEVDVLGQATAPPPISMTDVAFLAGGFVAGVVLMLVISRKRG